MFFPTLSLSTSQSQPKWETFMINARNSNRFSSNYFPHKCIFWFGISATIKPNKCFNSNDENIRDCDFPFVFVCGDQIQNKCWKVSELYAVWHLTGFIQKVFARVAQKGYIYLLDCLFVCFFWFFIPAEDSLSYFLSLENTKNECAMFTINSVPFRSLFTLHIFPFSILSHILQFKWLVDSEEQKCAVWDRYI